MKPNKSIAIFLISFLFIVHGCTEQEVKQKPIGVQHLADLSLENIPHKSLLNFDSLIIRIPGENGEELPEISTSSIPSPVDLLRIAELFPGISNLHQSEKQKRNGFPQVKSKKPVVIKVDYSKRKIRDVEQFELPKITLVSKPLLLNEYDISDYENIVNDSNLITIQHGDTIFPPLSLPVVMPKHVKSQPFRHYDYGLFDIRVLDEDQDLPNSFIRAIAKDNNGMIWFGTHTGGIISYDGHFFGQYNVSNGLSSNMVTSLLIDKNDNIWIGTEDNGVNLYDGRNITQFTIKQGLPSNNIRALLEDNNGNIWLATTEGVSMFNGVSFSTYTVNQGLNSDIVTSLYEDDKGNIWFGTYGGVTKYNPDFNQNEPIIKQLTNYTENDGLALNKVLSIAQDHNGNMWFGTNGGGVSMFNGDAFVNYSTEQGLGNNTILSIIEDSYNNLWFGTFGNGVTRFTGDSFSHYTTNEGLSDNYVRALFDDDEGNLWVGTDGNGVSSFIINSFVNFTTEQGLSNNLVLSIFQDKKNRMWFGAFEGGVLIYDEPEVLAQKGTFTHITTKQGLVDNTVASIIKDSNDNYWFGTYSGGVSMVDGESLKQGKLKFTNYSVGHGLDNNTVRSILQDDNGDIWMATEGGVTRFDGEKFVTITDIDGLGSSKVSTIFKDRKGYLWFGTIGGGVSCLKNDTLISYGVKQGLGSNTVWTINQDHNGLMWFGTNGGGLTCFNGNSFKIFNIDDGLSNNHVYSLILDNDNNMWVGTTRGLNQIKLPGGEFSTNKSIEDIELTIINYGKMDGLKSLDFFTNSALLDNKNRLWWGTADALSMLKLNNYISTDKAPVVSLNAININNELINFSELNNNSMEGSFSDISFLSVEPFSNIPMGLSLPYNLNQLTFRFSAIDWSSPNQIYYQYKLQGYDENWGSLTKNNLVDYRNIPSGRYTFMLRAIGKSDNWSSVVEYQFTIRYPFWLTWWAIIFYVIAFVISGWLLIRWRVSIVTKQKIELENLIHNRTKELDNSRKFAEEATVVKSQFIATMSHEIRTPLNAIMGLTHLAIAESTNPKQEDYLQKIDRSANTLLNLINDILDFSKAEAGKIQLEKLVFDIEVVINSVIILNSQFAIDKNLEFIVSVNPRVPRLLVGDSLRIGQVITNIVSNAIKFTAEGDVLVQIDISEKISSDELLLKVTVSDTGIGIEEHQIPYLFDEFNQADSSITRKFGGTGLGLSISKMLIEMMDGNIRVESELGKGTTFYFDFKVGVKSWDTIATHKIPDELKEFNILVCESNYKALETMVGAIQSFSLNVDGVSSSDEAIMKLKEKSYELLLINEQADDFRVIKSIRNDKNILPLKIILISKNKSTNSDEYDILIDGILAKPCIPSVILEKILSVFGMEYFSYKLFNTKEAYKIEKYGLGCHVLLAEDNEINMQVIFELLGKVNVNVDVAENGSEAVNKAKETKYDLILMDLHMPIMDGYEASAHIRKLGIETPIVALTADAMDSVKDRCYSIGINDIITKPVDPDYLYRKIQKWVGEDKFVVVSADNSGDFDLQDVHIPDLDLRLGVIRFGNNANLYMKVLEKFALSNTDICKKLRICINKSKYDEAKLIIHTLKGESGNIGANKVYEFAMSVEDAVLNEDVTSFENNIILLEESLNSLVLSINANIKHDENSSEDNELRINKLINELVELLKLKNPKAFDILDELMAIGSNKLKFDDINKAVKNGNIEEALFLLNQLLV